MKRVLLLPLIVLSSVLSAQNLPENTKINAVDLLPEEVISLQNDLNRFASLKDKSHLAKTAANGGQWMSHSDVGIFLEGNLLRPVFSPMAPDSTYLQVFKGIEKVRVHGFGQVFDPTSAGFTSIGQTAYTSDDSYTVDTIYVGIRYRTANLTSGLTGDTLSVEICHGSTSDNSVWRLGIGYPSNTYANQPSRIDVLTPQYIGNDSIGLQGRIKSQSKIVIKYPLSAADTAVNFVKIVPNAPINLAGGEKLGVHCTFIPGYTYDPATQLYFVSGGKADVNQLSWLYYTPRSSTDQYPYFLESYTLGGTGQGLSNLLFTNTRYSAWTGPNSFRNDYLAPTPSDGNLIGFWVRGKSSIGFNELEVNQFKVYPNPSNGLLEVETPGSGTFTMTLVNALGQETVRQMVEIGDNNRAQFDFSHVTKGSYILYLKNEKGSYYNRVLLN